MTKSSSTRFRCSGRFISFAPGKKSPYQNMVLAVVDAGESLEAEGLDSQEMQIKLSKSLRRSMFTYLEPQDWLMVEGKCKLDPRTDEMALKATDVVKLSPKQIEKVKAKAAALVTEKTKAETKEAKLADSKPKKIAKKKSAKPARVLVCQKGSCRKKGSAAVGKAFGDVLIEMGCDEKVTVKATGCMGHCKQGPNVVLLPGGGSHKRVKPKDVRSLVEKIL